MQQAQNPDPLAPLARQITACCMEAGAKPNLVTVSCHCRPRASALSFRARLQRSYYLFYRPISLYTGSRRGSPPPSVVVIHQILRTSKADCVAAHPCSGINRRLHQVRAPCTVWRGHVCARRRQACTRARACAVSVFARGSGRERASVKTNITFSRTAKTLHFARYWNVKDGNWIRDICVGKHKDHDKDKDGTDDLHDAVCDTTHDDIVWSLCCGPMIHTARLRHFPCLPRMCLCAQS